MPIQVAADPFVQFRYAPEYPTGKHRPLRADGEIGPTQPFIKHCVRSEIVLDGGNVVRWGGRAIVTDQVFRENATLSREVVVDAALRELVANWPFSTPSVRRQIMELVRGG